MSRIVRSVTPITTILALTVAVWPASLSAQSRSYPPPRVAQPRHVVHSHARVYRPYYYYSPFYFYGYWGGPWGPYGWYPSFYYGYGPYPYPYGYPHPYYYNESSLRIQVKPTDAEVFVDGYFVGVVDSYDGMFQRLHLPPGEHVIEIYHERFRPIREPMRFAPREGYELKRQMEPLAPGDPAPVRPKPDPTARPADRDPSDRYDRPSPRDRAEPPQSRQERSSESGAVAIRVQPAGAVVIINGEKWEGPDGPDRLVIHLSEGSHRVEIQKEGYRPFVTEVRIRRGETVPLNVSLRTGG